MNVLITGVAGFIGSHLCEYLIGKGYQVTGIDNFDPFYPRATKEQNMAGFRDHPHFNFIEGDAGDPSVLAGIKVNPVVVIHLAAKAGVQPSLKAPADYINTNILLTNRLLEWMRESGIKKFLFASSSSVYGNTATVPFLEDQDVNSPFSPYAFTKRSCELMNYTYHELYGMDVVNLRFFTVYGERQRPDLAIHKFVKKISEGEPIHLYGNGDTSRDYTYWKDTVSGVSAALEYLLKHDRIFESFNLGNSSPVTLNELVSAISDAMQVKPVLIYEDKKPGDVDITYADISKAQQLLGYNPATSLPEGLKKFVHWFREHRQDVSLKK
jgi:UDP-glucuronate 4-epimerase